MALVKKNKIENTVNAVEKIHAFQKKILGGPVMTKQQIKEFEKTYPWLKKVKD